MQASSFITSSLLKQIYWVRERIRDRITDFSLISLSVCVCVWEHVCVFIRQKCLCFKKGKKGKNKWKMNQSCSFSKFCTVRSLISCKNNKAQGWNKIERWDNKQRKAVISTRKGNNTVKRIEKDKNKPLMNKAADPVRKVKLKWVKCLRSLHLNSPCFQPISSPSSGSKAN